MSTGETRRGHGRVDVENTDQFLTFSLGSEHYGVEILRIREIIGLIDITPMPNTPSHIKGVINLRGKIIPVLDLRMKFGLPETRYTSETCVVVVEIEAGADGVRSQMGIIVDAVREVMSLQRADVEPPPSFGTAVDTAYVRGLGKTDADGQVAVVIILDIDAITKHAHGHEIETNTPEHTSGLAA